MSRLLRDEDLAPCRECNHARWDCQCPVEMEDGICSPRIARALRESGEREEATRREGIRNATRCAWCGNPIMNGAPCCDATPWRHQ